MYRHQGILYSDSGVPQTVNGPAPGNAEKSDGWAYDARGRGYVRTSGPIAYKYGGFSFTADGSMLVVNSSAQAVTDYRHNGVRYDQTGRAYQGTIKWK